MKPSDPHYRVDKFRVPEASRGEFLRLVAETHDILQGQAGFVRDYVVEKASDDGTVHIVTFAEWSDEATYAAAVETVRRFREKTGFDTRTALDRLGISADIGVYRNARIPFSDAVV